MFTFVTECKYTKTFVNTKKKCPKTRNQPRQAAASPGTGAAASCAQTLHPVARRYQSGTKAAGGRRKGKAGNKAACGRARRAVPTGGDRTRPGAAPPGGGKGHTKEERNPPPKREQPRRPPDTQAPKNREQPAKRPQVFISPAPAGGGGQRGRGQRGYRLGWERRR